VATILNVETSTTLPVNLTVSTRQHNTK
jgi:hypothetical protein